MLNFVYVNGEAYITNQKITGLNKVGTVKCRVTNYVVNILTDNVFNIKKIGRRNDRLFSLMKSNLQKQIRQQDINAVSTCDIMLELNDFECLRRLSVIAAEDVEISKETAVIVWLMAATSKNYVLSREDKQFILKYVNNLVHHPICKHLMVKCDNNISMNKILESNHPDKNYLAAILFRTSYGGLSGDLPMINHLCCYYFNTQLPVINDYPMVETQLDINDAAVDFHIYPSLCNEICSDTGINPDIIKRAIWVCSSRTNKRYHQDSSEYNEIWIKIKRSFDIRTKTYLQKILQKY